MAISINAPDGRSVPFEIKGGSPIVINVDLEGQGTFEVRIVLSVAEVRHLLDVVNASDPKLPTFALQTQMNLTTRKL